MAKVHRSNISKTEWGLVIALLAFIDIIQFILDVLLIGAIINEVIDVLVGLALPFYLHIRGESMSDPKRLGAYLATLGFEAVPFLNGLPFWTLDGIYNYVLAQRRNKSADAQDLKTKQEERENKIASQQEKNLRLQEARQDSRFNNQ